MRMKDDTFFNEFWKTWSRVANIWSKFGPVRLEPLEKHRLLADSLSNVIFKNEEENANTGCWCLGFQKGRLSIFLLLMQDWLFLGWVHCFILSDLNIYKYSILLETKIVVEATSAVGAYKLVMVSVDKAVIPTNLVVASKRIVEMILKHAGSRATWYNQYPHL